MPTHMFKPNQTELLLELRGISYALTIRRMSERKGILTRLIGVELYCDDLQRARNFYSQVLKLQVVDEDKARFVKFDGGPAFVCLERKGVESYPSQDKAVLFFAVSDLAGAIDAIGKERILQREATWAVLHDPEGHNILLLQQ